MAGCATISESVVVERESVSREPGLCHGCLDKIICAGCNKQLCRPDEDGRCDHRQAVIEKGSWLCRACAKVPPAIMAC